MPAFSSALSVLASCLALHFCCQQAPHSAPQPTLAHCTVLTRPFACPPPAAAANEDCNLYTYDMRRLASASCVHQDFVSAVMVSWGGVGLVHWCTGMGWKLSW